MEARRLKIGRFMVSDQHHIYPQKGTFSLYSMNKKEFPNPPSMQTILPLSEK